MRPDVPATGQPESGDESPLLAPAVERPRLAAHEPAAAVRAGARRLSTPGVVATIERAIAPLVGETMARASTEALRKKLGMDGPRVSDEQAQALVEKVRQGLIVFVGRERAGQVQSDILRRLAAEGGPR